MLQTGWLADTQLLPCGLEVKHALRHSADIKGWSLIINEEKNKYKLTVTSVTRIMHLLLEL